MLRIRGGYIPRIQIFFPSWIPESGVKKAPDPGSATLTFNFFLEKRRPNCWARAASPSTWRRSYRGSRLRMSGEQIRRKHVKKREGSLRWCGSGSGFGFNGVPGSGSAIRIRIQEGKNDLQK